MKPPQFDGDEPVLVNCIEGETVTLAVELPAGDEPLLLEWRRWSSEGEGEGEGVAADGASGCSEGRAWLRVEGARTGDAGAYVVRASNAAGAARRRVLLAVQPASASPDHPPHFVRRLTDLSVKVGARTRLLVEIASTSDLEVVWFRNDRRLMEAERFRIFREGRFFGVEVSPVSVEDGGRWTCTAENCGGRSSCSAHLNVIVPKAYKRPEFLEELRALLTEQGTVSLECKVVGVPTPVLRWFKDSKEIKAGDVFALTANPDDPTSLGTYTCEAVNCMGKTYSSSEVHVVGRGSREGSLRPADSFTSTEPPPIFTKELEHQNLKVGEKLTLNCQVVVPPWPKTVVWYNKEGRIDSSERYRVLEDGLGGYMVEVPASEWCDEGEWKCVATSNEGRVGISTCSVTMAVPKNYRKPRFMENLRAVLTEEGLVSFECKVVGFPTPLLSWFKDGQELKPGDVYQLTGTNSLGSYCCIARNCMGQASSSAELTVEDIQNQLNDEERLQLFSRNQAPKFIQGLKSQEAKINDNFRFSVKVSFIPEPSLFWYRDDQPIEESTRYKISKETKGVCHLDIQQLEFMDQAEWKCFATNEFGHSVTSCFLKLIIPRHFKKPRFLENLRAILSEEGAVNLECKVIGVPQPTLKWFKDGEELKPGDIHRIISGQDGTCCLGTYTCEAQNCMGIAASSASLLGFEDTVKANKAKKPEVEPLLQRNISLSTIHEERTSQMYDTPVGDITLDDKGEVSFSFDGKEVSVSLYETPDLTEEEALQIVEMYADQLSENVTEHNVVELPPLRFMKETSTSGNLLMEAIVIDVTPDYFTSAEEDLRTEADVDDMSIIEEPASNEPFNIPAEIIDVTGKITKLVEELTPTLPRRPPRKKTETPKLSETVDEFHSISKDNLLQAEAKNDESHQTSLSDQQTFASAKSLTKNEAETNQTNAELTDNVDIKQEKGEIKSVLSPEREEQSSAKISTEGFYSLPSKTSEEALKKIVHLAKICNVVQSHLQAVEEEVVMEAAKMSSAAAANKSLEIIESIKAPVDKLQTIIKATQTQTIATSEVFAETFRSFVEPVKKLQESLAVVEKCVEIGGSSHTLVQRTCVCLIETLSKPLQNALVVVKDIDLTLEQYLSSANYNEVDMLVSDMITGLKISEESIRSAQLIQQATELNENTLIQHTKEKAKDKSIIIQNIWKPVVKLQKSVEAIKANICEDENASDMEDYIMDLIIKPIQELQVELDNIEQAAVQESRNNAYSINMAVLETVVQPMHHLRNGLDSISKDVATGKEVGVLSNVVDDLLSSIIEIKDGLVNISGKFGIEVSEPFERSQDIIQQMARNLLSLQSCVDNAKQDKKCEELPDLNPIQSNLFKILENAIQLSPVDSSAVLETLVEPTAKMNNSFTLLNQNDMGPFLKSFNESLTSMHASICSIAESKDTDIKESLSSAKSTLENLQTSISNMESCYIPGKKMPIVKEEPSKPTEEVNANVMTTIADNILKGISMIEEKQITEPLKEMSCKIMIDDLKQFATKLLEFRDSVAAAECNVQQEPAEQATSLSDAKISQALAKPLITLNNCLNVVNEICLETEESRHSKRDFSMLKTLAKPLCEFHNELQIAHDEIYSQICEKSAKALTEPTLIKNLHELEECLLQIQQQVAVEAIEELSTLDDISAIKTLADATQDLVEAAAIMQQDVLETVPSVSVVEFEKMTINPVQTLLKSLTILQQPTALQAIKDLSENQSLSSLKTMPQCMLVLQNSIESIQNIQLEDVGSIKDMEHSKKVELAKSMDDLKLHVETLKASVGAENVDQNISEQINQVEASIQAIQENVLKKDTDKDVSRGVIVSLEGNLLGLEQQEAFKYEALGYVSEATDISALKTLAGPLEELRMAIGAVQQDKPWDLAESMKADKPPMSEKMGIALQDLLTGIAVVQKNIVTDTAESIKSCEMNKLETTAKTLQELQKCIAAVQEYLVNEPNDEQKSMKDFTYASTLAESLESVQKCIAVLEEHSIVDLSSAIDFEIPVEMESAQFAKAVMDQALMDQTKVLLNNITVITDIEKEEESIKAENKVLREKMKNLRENVMFAQKMFSQPVDELLQNRHDLRNILDKCNSDLVYIVLENLVENVTDENLKMSLEKSLDKLRNCVAKMKDTFTKVNSYQKQLVFNEPIKDIKNFAKEIDILHFSASAEHSLSGELAILETTIIPLKEICQRFELADISSDATIDIEHVLVASSQLYDPLKSILNSAVSYKNYVTRSVTDEVEREKILRPILELESFIEDICRSVDNSKIEILQNYSLLKSLSEKLKKISKHIVEEVKKMGNAQAERLEKRSTMAEIVEPIRNLQECLATVQKQLFDTCQEEDTLSNDVSLIESYAEPIIELQKDLSIIEQQMVQNNEIHELTEDDKTLIENAKVTIHDLRESISNIQESQINAGDKEMLKLLNTPLSLVEEHLASIKEDKSLSEVKTLEVSGDIMDKVEKAREADVEKLTEAVVIEPVIKDAMAIPEISPKIEVVGKKELETLHEELRDISKSDSVIGEFEQEPLKNLEVKTSTKLTEGNFEGIEQQQVHNYETITYLNDVTFLNSLAGPLEELRLAIGAIQEKSWETCEVIDNKQPKPLFTENLNISIQELLQGIATVQKDILTHSVDAIEEAEDVKQLEEKAKPLQELYKYIATVQQNLINEPHDDQTSMAEFSYSATLAESLESVQKCFAGLEQHDIMDLTMVSDLQLPNDIENERFAQVSANLALDNQKDVLQQAIKVMTDLNESNLSQESNVLSEKLSAIKTNILNVQKMFKEPLDSLINIKSKISESLNQCSTNVAEIENTNMLQNVKNENVRNIVAKTIDTVKSSLVKMRATLDKVNLYHKQVAYCKPMKDIKAFTKQIDLLNFSAYTENALSLEIGILESTIVPLREICQRFELAELTTENSNDVQNITVSSNLLCENLKTILSSSLNYKEHIAKTYTSDTNKLQLIEATEDLYTTVMNIVNNIKNSEKDVPQNYELVRSMSIPLKNIGKHLSDVLKKLEKDESILQSSKFDVIEEVESGSDLQTRHDITMSADISLTESFAEPTITQDEINQELSEEIVLKELSEKSVEPKVKDLKKEKSAEKQEVVAVETEIKEVKVDAIQQAESSEAEISKVKEKDIEKEMEKSQVDKEKLEQKEAVKGKQDLKEEKRDKMELMERQKSEEDKIVDKAQKKLEIKDEKVKEQKEEKGPVEIEQKDKEVSKAKELEGEKAKPEDDVKMKVVEEKLEVQKDVKMHKEGKSEDDDLKEEKLKKTNELETIKQKSLEEETVQKEVGGISDKEKEVKVNAEKLVKKNLQEKSEENKIEDVEKKVKKEEKENNAKMVEETLMIKKDEKMGTEEKISQDELKVKEEEITKNKRGDELKAKQEEDIKQKEFEEKKIQEELKINEEEENKKKCEEELKAKEEDKKKKKDEERKRQKELKAKEEEENKKKEVEENKRQEELKAKKEEETKKKEVEEKKRQKELKAKEEEEKKRQDELKANEEKENKKKEAEEKKRQDELKAKEEEEKKKKEDEEKKRKELKSKEEEDKKKKESEEKKRQEELKAKEEEEKKKKEAEEKKRQEELKEKEEKEQKKKEAEEKKRQEELKAKEEEEKKKKEAEEKNQQEELKAKEEGEKKKKEAEEKKRQEELKAKEEEEKKKKEAEEKKRQEELKAKEEEEKKKKEAEEKKHKEELKAKEEEDKKKKEAEEKKRQEELKEKEEKEKKKKEAEEKKRKEELKAKEEEEFKKKEAEEKKRQEELKVKEEEEKKRKEELKAKEEEDKKKKEAEEKKRQEELKEKENKKKEAEEKKRQEELKAKEEEEIKKKEAEEKKRQEELKAKEEEEKKKKEAEEKKLQEELKVKEEEEKKRKEELKAKEEEAKKKKEAEEKKCQEELKEKEEKEKKKKDAEKKKKKELEEKKRQEELKAKEEEEKKKKEIEEEKRQDELKAKEEEGKIKKKAEEKKRQEELKAKEEEEEKKKQEAEQRKKKEAEEKKHQEELKEEEEKKKKETEVKKKKDSEEKKRQDELKAKDEEAKKKKEAEEKKKEDAEEKKRQEELMAKEKEEEKRKKEAEEQLKKEAEEKKKKDAEEKKRQEELKLKEEKEKKKKETEEKKMKDAEEKKHQEEVKVKQEAEKKKKEIEEKKHKEELKAKEEEEKKKKDAEEKKRKEELKLKEEEEKKKKEAEEKKKKEAEEKKRHEELKAKEEEEKKKKKAEEKKKKDVEEKKRQEELKLKEEEEKKKKKAEETKKKEAEEKKRQEELKAKEAEEKKKKEVEEKKHKEELKAKEEEEKKKKEAEEKKKKDTEERKRKEELKLKEEEENKKKEVEEKKRKEKEKKKKEAEEKKRQEDIKLKEEEEKKKKDTEEKRLKEKEVEEMKKKEVEEKKRLEELKVKEEKEKKIKEAEEMKLKEKEAENLKRKEADEKKRIAEEEKMQKKERLETERKRLEKELEEAKKSEAEEKKCKELKIKEEAEKKKKEIELQNQLKEQEESEMKQKEKDAEKAKKKEIEKKKKSEELQKQKKEQEETENKRKEKLAEEAKKKEIEENQKKEEELNKQKREQEEVAKKRKEELKEKDLKEAKKKEAEDKIHKDELKVKEEAEKRKKDKEADDIKMKEIDEKKRNDDIKARLSDQKKKEEEETKMQKEVELQMKRHDEELRKRKEIEAEELKLKEAFEEKKHKKEVRMKEEDEVKERRDHKTKVSTKQISNGEINGEDKYKSKFGDVDSSSDSSYQKRTVYKSSVDYAEHRRKDDSTLATSSPAWRSDKDASLSESSRSVSKSEHLTKYTAVSRDIKKKPVFCTHLTDRTAVEGSRVKLTCSVLGTPEPQIEWYKNGVLLRDQNKYKFKYADGLCTLEVLNTLPSDSADYTCTATNENGLASSIAKLRVYAGFEATPIPPTFTRSIKDKYYAAEDELVLECRIRGQPVPSIIWLKDDKVLSGDSRYHMNYLADGVCRLVIDHPNQSDSGKYTCKAENPLWSDKITHEVYFAGRDQHIAHSPLHFETLRYAKSQHDARRPHFSTILSDHAVPKGGTIALQVRVMGSPADVVWLKGDRQIRPDDSKVRTFVEQGLYTLALSDATEVESGKYICRAINAYGNVDMTTSVNVISPGSLRTGKPALIVHRPEPDQSVNSGEDIYITCRAQGDPKPKMIWMKGLHDITNSRRSLKEMSDDYCRFTLKRAVACDAGTYCIMAKNCYGCDRAFVTVVVRQRETSDLSDHQTQGTGLNYVDVSYLRDVPQAVSCEPVAVDGGRNWVSLWWGKPATKGAAPVLAYRVEAWMTGGDGGARWVELGMSPINSFDAFNLRPGSEYLFRVTPKNRYGWGESTQTSTPIIVGRAVSLPEFTTTLPGQLKVLVDQTVTLKCKVKADCTPNIVWYKDSSEIELGDRITTRYSRNGECTLVISRVTEDDEGRYMCEAIHRDGRVSTFVRLSVVADPNVLEADDALKRRRDDDLSTVEYAPQFTMRLRDRRVQVTYPVRLTCQVIGNPTPSVIWTKNGEIVRADDRHSFWSEEHFHTLEISQSVLSDGGCYSAMACNSRGSVSCRCSLVVDKGIRAYMSPDFFCGLEPEYIIREGEELRISACVEAYPSVGIVWHRNGMKLRPSRRAVMTLDHDGGVELALANVTLRDAGIYTCTATNEVGKCSTSTKVVVERCDERMSPAPIPSLISPDMPYSKEPIFIKKPRSSEAMEGDTVIILCEVAGDPKPEVMWLRDFLKPEYYRDDRQFRRIGEGPEYRLLIPHAKLDHTGAYSVIAKNCHGEAKAVISLQIYTKGPDDNMDRAVRTGRVEVLPSISQELKDVRCCDGDAITFECRIKGVPSPTIKWEKDGMPVPNSGDFKFEMDSETARLVINNVYPEDEGMYTCIASNALGKAYTSSCLIVDVPEEKENMLSQQLVRPPVLLSAGSTPRSTPCRSPSPSPVNRIRESISQTRRTSRWKLCPPKFYAVPFNRVAEEGETVVFRCSIAGHPVPWVVWDKDGVEVSPSARITIKEHEEDRILQITDVTFEDAGLYKVTVDNEVGRVEATARLEVLKMRGSSSCGYLASDSLSFRRRLVNSTTRTSEDFTLRSETRNSHSSLRSKWYKNGHALQMTERVMEIRENNAISLCVKSARVADKGVYTVVLSNDAEEISSWANVVVEDKQVEVRPKMAEPLHDVEAIDGQTVELRCRVESCCSFEVLWTKDDQIVPDCEYFQYVDYGNGAIGLRFDDVFAQDSGKYTCKVISDRGSCRSSCLLLVKDDVWNIIRRNDFSTVPQPVVIEEGKTANFEVRIRPNAQNKDVDIVWQVAGKIVNKEQERFKMTSTPSVHTLQIANVNGNDSGIVRCSLVSKSDSERLLYEGIWQNTNLTVVPTAHISENLNKQHYPQFLSVIGEITAIRGKSVLINVPYRAEPLPTVRWMKSEEEIISNDRFVIKNEVSETLLEIKNVNKDDGGKYCVEINNKLGHDSQYFFITVEGPPDSPPGKPTVSRISNSVSISWPVAVSNLNCPVTGYSLETCNPNYKTLWKVIARNVSSNSITIDSLEKNQIYLFRVRAENAYGVSDPGIESAPFSIENEDEKSSELKLLDDPLTSLFNDKYKTYDVLGRGKFGIVKLVVNKHSNEKMAAKFIKTLKPMDKENVLSELDIMHCLKHPKLIQLIEAYTKPSEMIIVTEYVSGGELFERVSAEDFTLTERDCALFMSQICEGVKFMHDNSIVHLDLKPENIMCQTRPSQEIKIIDFGLARRLNPNEEIRVFCGTPEFIAPEVVNYDPISKASDMWSIGVICYVLLSGLSPFSGDTLNETYSNILQVSYDFEDEAFENITSDAKEFIENLLVRSMDKRCTAEQCLQSKWILQHKDKRYSAALSTDKLKKFVYQSKWQITGNAIRALGRMVSLSTITKLNANKATQPKLHPISEQTQSISSKMTYEKTQT